jgi:polysaccharide deacetylase 2 family uncharacterized protein YibQ
MLLFVVYRNRPFGLTASAPGFAAVVQDGHGILVSVPLAPISKASISRMTAV